MKEIKRTKEHRIYQKKSGRYAVTDARKRPVNGEDKATILLAEGLVAAPKQKAPEPVATEETAETAEETSSEPAAESA
ncbi:hypothetical protein [Thiorhodovibrio frisius]|uniref:Uncharacterized protein n=1 Tax=Thiorhodovibrio frisius TaxID=631362 RepID=H8Z2Z1_9GAMM|nr:hypothetical protein [Thiorhodovibrio frisius]EIC22763.1 hypothetical protein Thi970DRAFT_03045 [Thiorhodovibrio frisius]WPL22521.1 hypothetical protein Thiofri_02688 [Thiorhodovibrio frisius]